ncbi:MAG: hypothetical protein EZS28_013533 [Streblomastix strix]|uniref:Uncharacterized protein n=1 Tax=Streblomastix strix TaxID=222440 RepID=A0A5J4W7Q1_9EUKA|nr:MAG: hypothetical protein EZS28_013533 [Streblomastix strix]
MSAKSRRRRRNQRLNEPQQSQSPLNKAKINKTAHLNCNCNGSVTQYLKSNVINSKIAINEAKTRHSGIKLDFHNLTDATTITVDFYHNDILSLEDIDKFIEYVYTHEKRRLYKCAFNFGIVDGRKPQNILLLNENIGNQHVMFIINVQKLIDSLICSICNIHPIYAKDENRPVQRKIDVYIKKCMMKLGNPNNQIDLLANAQLAKLACLDKFSHVYKNFNIDTDQTPQINDPSFKLSEKQWKYKVESYKEQDKLKKPTYGSQCI